MGKLNRLILAFIFSLLFTVISAMLLFVVLAAFAAAPGLTLVAIGLFIGVFLIIERLMDKEFR